MGRADELVRFRETDKGQRQRDVLRGLENRSERKRSAIVADLDAAINVGHDQYRRYLRGDTPLRWDQIDVFARVFGVTSADLTRSLGLLDDDVDPVLRARAAEALGPEMMRQMPERADDIARELAKYDEPTQRDALADIRHAMPSRAGDITA